MIGMREKVYWLVMLDYEYEFVEEWKNVYGGKVS